jgi:ATP-dependent protease ClpP protease subunit
MAAGEIRAAGNSFLMMHNPHGLCVGGADAMRKMADLLDKVKAPLVAAYRRSGKDDAAIERLMNDETWYSAEDAKKNGFVDHVDQPIEIAASFDLARFGYRHPPQPNVGASWDRVIHGKFAAR